MHPSLNNSRHILPTQQIPTFEDFILESIAEPMSTTHEHRYVMLTIIMVPPNYANVEIFLKVYSRVGVHSKPETKPLLLYACVRVGTNS